MVLIRTLTVLLLVGAVAAAGCGESLFDAHGGGRDGGGGDDGGGDDAAIPTTCLDPCLGDAADDFNGSQGGSTGNRWHYFDDHRDRNWTLMMADGADGFTGGDTVDKITTCAKQPSAAACAGMSNALLVTSTGTILSDPSIEYKSPMARVIQLSFHAHVPGNGAGQRVRLYRNSREDVLFTGDVMPGTTVSQTLPVVDALQGDRFLIALEPLGTSGGQVALNFFVNGTGRSFPTECLLALSFESATGATLDDLCDTKDFTSLRFVQPPATPPTIAPRLNPGPFIEQGFAADFALGEYYASEYVDALPANGDTTIQFWVRHDTPVPAAILYSNLDQDDGGGLRIQINGTSIRRLQISAASKPNATMYFIDDLEYPMDAAWHFLRMVHTNGTLYTCIDGIRRSMLTVPAGSLASTYPVFLGRNLEWDMTLAPEFDGRLDDVRVFAGALPCEPPN